DEPGDFSDLALILDAVRNGREPAVRAAADRREEAGGGATLILGQPLDPRVDLLLRRGGRVKVRLRRLRGRTGDEGGVLVEARPRAFVDHEVPHPRTAQRRVVTQQIE